MTGELPPKPPPGGAKAAPGPKVFNCPQCGAQLSISVQGTTLVVACKSCGSIVDVTDENYKILSHARAKKKYEPTIPIGAKGKLRGETWKVIGFVVREDVASSFRWNEYLLYNPRQGFRWLTENNGHWNYVIMTRKEVKFTFGDPHYQGFKYRLYQRGEARVVYVVGEFYWRVEVGERAHLTDYVRPPEMLSLEQRGNEKLWSIGEYVEPATLKEGFPDLKDYVDRREGVAPNQPQASDRYWKDLTTATGLLLTLLIAAQVFSSSLLSKRTIVDHHTRYSVNTPKSESQAFTIPFEITSRRSALDIEMYADVSNAWFAVEIDIVNDETGQSVEFEHGVEFYFGRDSDGGWTEGSRIKTVSLSSVPRGKYHLTVVPTQAQGTDKAAYYIKIIQNPTIWANFILSFFALAAVPILVGIVRYRFEVKRWRESDYAPQWARTSSEDDDE